MNDNPIHCPFPFPFPSPTTHHHLPAPPSIANLWSANVTGTTFCVYWSSQLQMNQTYGVAVRKGSEVIQFWETSHTMIEVTGLQPGVLYNVTVTPCACGSQGVALHISVRTGKNCANNQREVDSSGAFNFF